MGRRTAEQERLALFHQGSTISAYDFMGAHPDSREGEAGYVFRVWTPAAAAVRPLRATAITCTLSKATVMAPICSAWRRAARPSA